MRPLLLAIALSSLPVLAQEDSTSTEDIPTPVPEESTFPTSSTWTLSLSQWGQAGDTSSSHQTTLSGSWNGRWSILRFTPRLQVLRSYQTTPDSTWYEVEPSAKLGIDLGTGGSLVVSGWSTTLQSPWDFGGALRLSGSTTPWVGGDWSGWASVQDSRQAEVEWGLGSGIDQDLTGRLSASASAGAWWSRQTLPSGKTNSTYTPAWSLGSGLSWDDDSWSLSGSGEWNWYEAERSVKSNRKILSAMATASESVRHDDWSLSLDGSYDLTEALRLSSDFTWTWTKEDGAVDVTANLTGKKMKLSPTSLATVENGPSWDLEAIWSW